MSWLLHAIGADTGTSRWYYFWSGFGSGPIAWCILPLAWWRHHNCHARRCWRTGHPDTRGTVRCRRHLSPGITDQPAGSLAHCADTDRAEPRDIPTGFTAPEARAAEHHRGA